MREKLIDIVEAYADFLDWDTKEEMVDSVMEFLATDNNVGDKKISALEKSNRNWRRKHQRLKAAMRQRWIPVTERLPEVGKKVLCCGPTGGLFIARTRACAGRVLIIDDKSSVQRKATNWMPLPEPPKGE
jgi:hypothetical protein